MAVHPQIKTDGAFRRFIERERPGLAKALDREAAKRRPRRVAKIMSRRKREILEFMALFFEDNGRTPTQKEIASAFEKKRQNYHRQFEDLVTLGYLAKDGRGVFRILRLADGTEVRAQLVPIQPPHRRKWHPFGWPIRSSSP